MEPDEFLDWLEEKRDTKADSMGEVNIYDLIDDFNQEFDTRDSPYVTPNPDLKKKKKKKR